MSPLDPGALKQLRDLLKDRGRPSIVPPVPLRPAVAPLTEDQVAQLERVARICELLFLMMGADGECGDQEREMLRGVARALSAGALRSAQIDAMLRGFAARQAAEGTDTRLQAVAARLQTDHAEAEAAYSLAAAMALANEQVDSRERELLHELGELLGLSEKRRAELTQGTPP